jgi:hypothetical protein
MTTTTLGRLPAVRGAFPGFVRTDVGSPKLTAHAPRYWCRLADVGASYIEPDLPWQDTWIA